MLQKIEASLLQLVAPPNVSAEHLSWATSQVNLFFGSFRKADADDPETFTAGCLRLFTAYPPAAVRHVVDPVTGLPGRSEWLPTMKAIKEALDGWAAEEKRAREFEARLQAAEQQIADRKAWQEKQKTKPTLEEMKAKYGDNWGLKSASPESQESKAKRTVAMQEANRAAFEAECKAAGMPLDSTASPSLTALIKAGMA